MNMCLEQILWPEQILRGPEQILWPGNEYYSILTFRPERFLPGTNIMRDGHIYLKGDLLLGVSADVKLTQNYYYDVFSIYFFLHFFYIHIHVLNCEYGSWKEMNPKKNLDSLKLNLVMNFKKNYLLCFLIYSYCDIL